MCEIVKVMNKNSCSTLFRKLRDESSINDSTDNNKKLSYRGQIARQQHTHGGESFTGGSIYGTSVMAAAAGNTNFNVG